MQATLLASRTRLPHCIFLLFCSLPLLFFSFVDAGPPSSSGGTLVLPNALRMTTKYRRTRHEARGKRHGLFVFCISQSHMRLMARRKSLATRRCIVRHDASGFHGVRDGGFRLYPEEYPPRRTPAQTKPILPAFHTRRRHFHVGVPGQNAPYDSVRSVRSTCVYLRSF